VIRCSILARHKGDTHLALVQRRDNVKQLLLHHARLDEMAAALRVSEHTIRSDVEAVLEEWRKDEAVRNLWSHKAAFDNVNELERQFWAIYHRKPMPIAVGKRMITPDNSWLQVAVLKNLHLTLRTKNIMRGIGTVKVFEQLRYIESEKARGFLMTRSIGFEDQMKAGADKLEQDLEWQRREGLIRDNPTTTT
jgi:hypothetical protein